MFNKEISILFLILSCVVFKQSAFPPGADPVLENVVVAGSGAAVFFAFKLADYLVNDQCVGQCGAYGAGAVFSTVVTLASVYRCANPNGLISTRTDIRMIEFYKNKVYAMLSSLSLSKRRL